MSISEGAIAETVELFKALADETRLRILKLLLSADEGVCVCELVEALDLPQYRVSRHLNILKRAGLLEAERSGAWVYYSPARDAPPLIAGLFSIIRDRLVLRTSEEDLEHLRERLALRVRGACVVGSRSERGKECPLEGSVRSYSGSPLWSGQATPGGR